MRLFIELCIVFISISLIVGRFLYDKRNKQIKKETDFFNKRTRENIDLKNAINEVNREFPSSDISIDQFIVDEKNKTP